MKRRAELVLLMACFQGLWAFCATQRVLRLLAPASYHRSLPFPLRVDIIDAETGKRDTHLWDAQAAVSVTGTDAAVQPAGFHLYNGAGNVLLNLSGSGDLTLRVEVEGLRSERTVTELDLSVRDVTGPIDESTTWGPAHGVIHLLGTAEVGPEATLTVLPGTTVALEGKAGLRVRGQVHCLGTETEPIVFLPLTSSPWGEIRHDQASGESSYQYCFFLGGGDSAGAGHTGRGPVLRVLGSKVACSYCSFQDNYGKGAWGQDDSQVSFFECHFSRSAMGMEVGNTAILVDRCAFVEFPGTGDEQDNDALYLHGGSPDILVRDSVFAVGGDDGIDTLGSDPVIQNCVLRNWRDKGISIFHGSPSVSRCIIVENDKGISSKGDDTRVTVDHCTLVRNPISLEIRLKYNTHPEDEIWLTVTNCIAWETEKGIRSDYPPEYIDVSYSDLGGEYYARVDGDVIRYPTAAVYPGEGNLSEDPRFVDSAAYDFSLHGDSPCVDSGDPAFALDPDGTRTDLGALPYLHTAVAGIFRRGFVNSDDRIDISDAIALLRYLFLRAELPCLDAADLNDSGALDLADPIHLLSYLYSGGPAPEAPFLQCGPDGTEDSLHCAASPACAGR